jgi:malonate-semialdehyde dehydrogenase (acetylating) / methylmalonate-semialdehyde dehydrogenase
MSQVQMPETQQDVYNFVGGAWQKPQGPSLPVMSPYFGKAVGTVYCSTAEDVDQAVQAAKAAFPAWAALPLKNRTQIMFGFRDILLRDLDTIAHAVSLENGKTIGESRAGIMKGVEVLEFALSLQNTDSGGRMEVSRGVYCEYRREPLGVVSSITPFNFPAMVPMWTLPIAITLGNAFVWKPSEKTPMTSLYIANALKEAGLPDGILTVVQGDRVAVEAITDHPDIQAISFVGSTKIAETVYKRSTNNSKRCLALGGAKNHIILLPDADPQMSGLGISDSFTGCAGQRCMAASVLLAVGDVDPIIDQIVAQAASQEVGNTMGAIITAEQVKFLHEAIAQAEADGATVRLDGRKATVAEPYGEGFWIGPTVLDNVKPGTQAATVELFGPIISIVRCQNISEAMAIENSSSYGNAASVFTSSGAMADYVARHASAGMVGVNIGVPVPREPFSFGGINASKFGHGDITGAQSLDFWTNTKKVTSKWAMQNDHNWMS